MLSDESGMPVRRIQPGCRKFSGSSHNPGGQQAQGQGSMPNWTEFLPPPPEHPPPSNAGSDSGRLLVPVSII